MKKTETGQGVIGELQLVNGYRRLSVKRRWAFLEILNLFLQTEFTEYQASKSKRRKKGNALSAQWRQHEGM